VKREDGFTLLEVLSALLITGIFLLSALSLFEEQWKGARILKGQLEAHYAVMSAGKTISDEIRRAKKVEWVNETCELEVLPMPDEANPIPTQDSYFIADLDRDGTKDFYWRHLGVSQPIASYLTSWESREVEPGLWDVSLKAIANGQKAMWRLVIRQRAYTKPLQ
jgi:prepilin-type N-terminal cleavage/methylation domain-containing protein